MTTTKAKRRERLRHLMAQTSTIEHAIVLLREAHGALRATGSKNAADYVARAIKSAEGALRHAENMCDVACQASRLFGNDLGRAASNWRRPK